MLADYIIVGQGITGSVLSLMLMQERKKVIVIDNNPGSSSSKVAAGLYNPIVFKRISKSWLIDETLPFADNFYRKIEHDFAEKLYFKKPIAKIFVNEEERNLWLKKAIDMRSYMTDEIISCSSKVKNPLGASLVHQSGHLAVQKMLMLVREELREKDSYIEEHFEYDQLVIGPDKVSYKGTEAKKIIFCEGKNALLNPYFSWLPFVLTKGEMLVVEIKDFEKEVVINKGVFILSIGDNLYKVGATYDWNDLTETRSEKGREELIEKLEKVINTEYKIVDQLVGIRPTVKDRRPFVGSHPDYSNVFILNGMGSKAVLLAPYFASQLVNFIEDGTSLNKEVDLKRFHHLKPV